MNFLDVNKQNEISKYEKTKDKFIFDDIYIIYNTEFVFFNDENFYHFEESLIKYNKIAVIFATSKEGYSQIPDSPHIIKHLTRDKKEKNKIIQQLKDEFQDKLDAYEAQFTQEMDISSIKLIES
jgi:hypothetical protein